MRDNVWGLRLFMREFFIAAMLNPLRKSCSMQEFNKFGRILAGLIGSYEISPLWNKNVQNNKNVKNGFLKKNKKTCKKRFYNYGMKSWMELGGVYLGFEKPSTSSP